MTAPARRIDVYRAAVALDVLAARARTIALLRRAGADVDRGAGRRRSPTACVRSYLRAKSQGLL